MILPWLQVDEEAFERAVELAALLEIDDAQAMGHLVHLWRWSLSRPADPELTGEVRGGTAIVQIEAGARWRGKRGALVEALIELGLMATEETGKRVKGLERYRAQLEKRAQDRERKAVQSPARTSDGVPEEFQRNALGKSGQTQTQTQTQMQKPSSSKTAEPPPSRVISDSPADAFWRWAQDQREQLGAVREKPPHPRSLGGWFAKAMLEVGDEERLRAGWRAFAGDPFWQPKSAPWSGWVSQWERFVPPKAPDPDRELTPEAREAVARIASAMGDYQARQARPLAWVRNGNNLIGSTDDPFFARWATSEWSALGLRVVSTTPLPVEATS